MHKICLVGCVRMRNAVDTKNQGEQAVSPGLGGFIRVSFYDHVNKNVMWSQLKKIRKVKMLILFSRFFV